MKANEAPEKIYVHWSKHAKRLCASAAQGKGDIDYIRTDTFIEKALKWYCLDCECNDNCKDTKCFFHNEYKRFLEGKENACPPKFERTINPDGSITENYHYRHFISRMQDAFIEKACKFISDRVDIPFNVECSNGELLADSYIKYASSRLEAANKIIEDFKKYMKG